MQSTLLLNASYEPLAIVSATRAVGLILANKAVALDESEATLSSANMTINLPYVARLNHFVKKGSTFRPARFSRHGVMIRDNNTCVYCGKHATTIDHVVPRYLGGTSTYQNCVAACTNCNRKKGHKTLKEMGWDLSYNPKAPSLFATLLSRAKNDGKQYEAWSEYILMFEPELANRH